MEYVMNGRIPGPRGNRDAIMSPHGYYPCKGDGQWVSIAVKTEEEWGNFCQATNNPLWADDERFSDRYSRLLNQDALDKLVSQWTAKYTTREVTEILQKAGVAAAPFLISREQYNDPHFNERGLFVKVDHPKSGTETFYGIPLKLSDTPGAVRSSGPMLGQHNEYVFKQLMGLSDDEFNSLREQKVIY